MKRSYSEDFIANALATLELNQGNTKATARELAIHESTLRNWTLRKAAQVGLTPEKKQAQEHDFAGMWANVQSKVLTLLEAKASEASVKDLSILAGIAADKHLDYRDGRKGTEVHVNNIVPVQVIVKDGEAI